jgi:hypothetical protein
VATVNVRPTGRCRNYGAKVRSMSTPSAETKPNHIPPPRPEWAEARRIVVKIGSALLVDPVSGRLNSLWLHSLGDDVVELAKAGKEVILVSSGAIR